MIPVFRPSMTRAEANAVSKTLKSNWIGPGPRVREFEEKFGTLVGAKCSVATSSCTAALEISVQALKLERKEAILPAITFVSTADVLLRNGLTPLFCDIDKQTMCIDPKSIEENITERTGMILAVHMAGQPADMHSIHKIARKYGLKVIEDAAHAVGAKYSGKSIGGLDNSSMACFSFEAKKILTCGDGGMISFQDDSYLQTLKLLRNQGINSDTISRLKGGQYTWDYDVVALGERVLMNDISASIGLAQLGRFEKIKERRNKLVAKYYELLHSMEEIELPSQAAGTERAWWAYIVKINNSCERDALMSFLGKNGIATSVHYKPLYYHPLLKPYARDLPNTEEVWRKMVSLPFFTDLKNAELIHVAGAIKKFFSGKVFSAAKIDSKPAPEV